MTDLEKQIEEAAEAEYSTRSGLLSDREHYILCSAYVTGAKSPEAKAFHQQGMYSEDDLYGILNNFRKQFSLHRGIQIMDFDIKEFINQNKKK